MGDGTPIDEFAERIEELLAQQQARVLRAQAESLESLQQAIAWRESAYSLAKAVLDVDEVPRALRATALAIKEDAETSAAGDLVRVALQRAADDRN